MEPGECESPWGHHTDVQEAAGGTNQPEGPRRGQARGGHWGILIMKVGVDAEAERGPHPRRAYREGKSPTRSLTSMDNPAPC